MSKELDELNDFINQHFSKLNAEIEKRIASGELAQGPINPYTGEVSARWCLEHGDEPFPVGAGDCIREIKRPDTKRHPA